MNCKICGKEFTDGKTLVEHLKNEHAFVLEDVYSYFNYSFESRSANCPICGASFKITPKQAWKYRKGISKGIGCNAKCSKTLLNIFSGCPFSREDVRKKAQEALTEKYGPKGSLGNSEVRNKGKKTLLEKYGVSNAAHIKGVRDKAKETMLERYGVEHAAQSEEIRNKMKSTNLERYGVEHAAQAKSIKDKTKNYFLEKYGVDNVSKLDSVKTKKKETLLKNYGVENPMFSQEIKSKALENMKITNLERYGVEFPIQNKDIFERIKRTNKEKYGVEFSICSEQAMEKTKQTNLERYGVENVFQNEEIQRKAQETNREKYGYSYASQSPEIKEKIVTRNRELYGVDYFCQHEKCSANNGFRISKINKKFHELLVKNGVDSELEFIVENSGFDLKSGNTLIEINPYFTHNSTIGPAYGGHRRPPLHPEYHLNKTLVAKNNGFHCIHIFDWDDENKIIELLKEREKIQARKCEVRYINNKKAGLFLRENHLQGSTRTLQCAVGLYYNNELVQVMTFGKPRYNKKYEYELLRLCTKNGINVVGGASKLLSFFERQETPKSIISYCDLSKFNGYVYEQLGFYLESQTPPTKHWYHPKTKKHITDNLLRQRGFDQIHGTSFGKGTSNEQLMIEHGYVEVYDCGQLVFTKHYKS